MTDDFSPNQERTAIIGADERHQTDQQGVSVNDELTLTINDSAAHKARLVAQRRRMTVDALIQGLIEQLNIEDKDAGNRACEALERSFQEVSASFGGKLWTERDELYDR